MSSVAAVAGTMLGIKPILTFSREGKLVVADKVRGMKRAFALALEKMEKYPPSDEHGFFWIVHTDAEEDAHKLADMVEERYGVRPDISIMGPVIGSHVGPGAVAIIWKSDIERNDG